MKILDLSYLKKHPYEDGYTVKEILEEARSEGFAKALGNVKTISVKREFLDKVKKVAEEIGVLGYLSDADLKLVALALEHKDDCVLCTNDFHIQNLCYFLGIKFQGDVQIEKALVYRFFCENCKRITNREICHRCGSLCKRFVVKEIDLKTNQP